MYWTYKYSYSTSLHHGNLDACHHHNHHGCQRQRCCEFSYFCQAGYDIDINHPARSTFDATANDTIFNIIIINNNSTGSTGSTT